MLGAILLPGADEVGGRLLGRSGLDVCCTGGAPEDGGGAVSMAATV